GHPIATGGGSRPGPHPRPNARSVEKHHHHGRHQRERRQPSARADRNLSDRRVRILQCLALATARFWATTLFLATTVREWLPNRRPNMLIKSRREFLKIGIRSVSALGALGAVGRFSEINALAAGGPYQALVCIFLSGGNDGHNTVVPVTTAQQNYPQYAS